MSRKKIPVLFPVLSVIFLWSVLLINSCSFDEPVLPSWEATYNLPFFENFILGEALDLDSVIIAANSNDPDSVLQLSLQDSLELLGLEPVDLSIAPESRDGSAAIDTLRIDAFETIETPLISISELIPGIDSLVGFTITIPDCTIGPFVRAQEAGDFQQIQFLSGTIRLRITNHMPLTIGPNNNSNGGLDVRVVSDSLPGEEFAVFQFANDIAPGQSSEEVVFIDNKSLYSPVRFQFSVPIADTSQFPVNQALLDTAGIEISLSVENIRATDVVARISSQEFDEIVRLGYDETNRLRQAVIDSGGINMRLTNFLEIASTVTVEIPAVVDVQNNEPFRQTVELAVGASTRINLDLDDLLIQNPDDPGELIDSLQINLFAVTDSSTDIIHLSAGDSIAFQIESDSVFLGSFSGFLGQENLSIPETRVENIAEYQGLEGGIELQNALLRLRLFSELQIDNLAADIIIRAFHRNENGQLTDSARLVLPNQVFNGGTPANPGITDIVLADSDILNIINILPTDLAFEGEVRLSGNAEVALGNRISAEYSFETPLTLRAQGLAPLESGIDTLTQEALLDIIQNNAEENLLGAALRFTITNQTPLGGAVRFILSRDAADTNLFDAQFDTSLGFIREVTMNAAPVDPQTGFVTQANQQTAELFLTQQQIRLFSRPPLWYAFQVNLADTEGFITLRSFDFIELNGAIAIEARIDPD